MKRRWVIVTVAGALMTLTSLPTAAAGPGGSGRPFNATRTGHRGGET